MGAIWRGSKQYFVRYVSDKMVCQSYEHMAGKTSSIQGAKNIIRRIRKLCADENPRDFKVYDSWADVPEGVHVPCVYQED